MKRRWKGKFMKEGKRSRLNSLSESRSSNTNETESHLSEPGNDPIDGEKSGWRVGRRIVELGYLADQLKSCKNCANVLHLHNVKSEQRIGYASLLYVDCECGYLNSITAGKSHRPSDKSNKGMPVYDINTKSVLGVMHSGLTYRQMNGLMATMEIRGLHHSSMIRREEEIHPHIEHVAKQSCTLALQDEISTINSTDDTNEGVFKYDMGWQKRGSGRSYDSKSGVGTLIGNNTGKICAYGVRISDCRICFNARRKGNEENVPIHNCVRNWSGSAKAMESDVGVDLVQSVESAGVKVSTIIMDDDATTMARLRQDIHHSITKWSDTNHTSKHLTNSLFTLQKKHKCLTNNVIAYFKKCFNYALSQTKGDVVNCKLQIEQIVPHAFGEHSKCGDWCGYKCNPSIYKHGTLSKDLSGEELRKDLNAVFSVFANNAGKIAPGGSTKEIESFNNMVASKAPKRCHFSASGNLLSRVGCAVAQKNIGNSYIKTVNEHLNLSPGKVYSQVAKSRDSERKRQLEYSSKKENKLRKLQNKLHKKQVQTNKEKKEGTTYKTAVAVHDDITIPTHRQSPKLSTKNSVVKMVFCDIETGSLAKDADILQLAACVDGQSFNEYLIPSKPISFAASRVTGLTAQGGVLFLNGSPVPAVPLRDCLENFVSWLGDKGPVVLVGHNFKVFDFPRILQNYRKLNLESQFSGVCVGGIDTLPLFKDLYPNLSCYKQEILVDTLLKEKYAAHNALDDVLNLEKLFKHANVSPEKSILFSFSTLWGIEHQIFQEETARNAQTLQVLIERKILSTTMVNKIASSGLCFIHLQSVYKSSATNGLVHLFSEKHEGKARITSNKKVLEKLSEFLKSTSDD